LTLIALTIDEASPIFAVGTNKRSFFGAEGVEVIVADETTLAAFDDLVVTLTEFAISTSLGSTGVIFGGG